LTRQLQGPDADSRRRDRDWRLEEHREL